MQTRSRTAIDRSRPVNRCLVDRRARRRARPRARRSRERASSRVRRPRPTTSRRSMARCWAGESSARSHCARSSACPAPITPIGWCTARAMACPGLACDVLGRTPSSMPTPTLPRARQPARGGGRRVRSPRRCGDQAARPRRRRRGHAGHHRHTARRARRHEHGVPYEIHPLGGLNVGLFTDMREHRRGLRASRAASACSICSPTPAPVGRRARAPARRAVTSVDTSAGVHAGPRQLRALGLPTGAGSSRPATPRATWRAPPATRSSTTWS